MTALQGHGGSRQSLTFSLNGLSARDETLFKSFVRLLAHRTLQQWTFAPQDADVCVAGQDAPAQAPSQKVLVVGATHRGETHFISTPFHADALEQALNDLGSSVTGNRPPSGNASLPDRPAAQFRLLRWPPAGLLTSTDHMRLATMMTGKWTTLPALHERSGVALQVCNQFMVDLQQAGLLLDAAQSAHGPAHAARPRAGVEPASAPARNIEQGLISRIRSRLGIFSAGRM